MCTQEANEISAEKSTTNARIVKWGDFHKAEQSAVIVRQVPLKTNNRKRCRN